MLHDLRFAVRSLAKSPGFALAAVIILALGIGANSAIFSLVDAILFRPLPVPAPERVVRLFFTDGQSPDLGGSTLPFYQDLRDQASVFSGLAAYSPGNPIHFAVGGAPPERLFGGIVTGNYFQTLGVNPAAGRLLIPADDQQAAPVVVLSHQLWVRSFHSDPRVVGSAVRLNGQTFTIVGVTPPDFWGTNFDERAEVWVPMAMAHAALPQFDQKMITSNHFTWLDVIGRLRDGVSLPQAEAQVRSISKRRVGMPEKADPMIATLRPAAGVAGGTSDEAATMHTIARVLLAVVLVVLLIACADVAGLMLVRSERRRKEIAVRLAMGSSRNRVFRQLLMESLIIAGAAAIAALVVAVWCVRLFVAALPPNTPFAFSSTARVLDLRVLAATALTAIVAGIAFGVLPALRVSGQALLPAIRNEASRGSARSTLGRTFVIVQVTLAAVLLITAGLLLRTFRNARSVNPGFDPHGKVVASMDLAREGYAETDTAAVWARILERVRALPSIRGAALARTVPVQNSGMRNSVVVEGYYPPPGTHPNVNVNIITPGYFRTLGVPILRGRDFTDGDVKDGKAVAVINRAMADEFWPGRDPIGKYIGDVDAEVVGVVENVRERSLREPAAPSVYRPLTQFSMSGMTLLVDSDAPTSTVMAGLSAAIRDVNPDLPLFQLWTLEQKMGFALAQERLMAAMVGAFSLLALLLAAGGLYSVIAYATQLRRREFGIRMALGAERSRILRGVLGESVTLTVTGLLLGIAIAAAVTRFAQSLLFEVSPLDPSTFGAVAAVLLLAGLSAAQLPAYRAMSTDPANVLRHE